MGKKKPASNGSQVSSEVRKGVADLERQRLNLQNKAVRQQQREMGLLRKQLDLQNSASQQQLGLLRSQLQASEQAATTLLGQQQQQLAIEQKNQKAAVDEVQRNQLESDQNRRALAGTQLAQLNRFNQKKSIQLGLLSRGY